MSLNEQEKILAIQNLNRAISSSSFNKDEAYEILRETESDPHKSVNDHLQRIKKLQIHAEINSTKTKRKKLDLLNIAKEKIKGIKNNYNINPINLIKQTFPDNAQFQFRKLDDISDNDLLEMLEETQLLKLIQELEKNNNG